MGNESEVVLSISLEDNVSPALASLEAGYGAALASLEAATLASAAALEAAWLAPVRSLSAASREALSWLTALGDALAAVGAMSAAPTVSINDQATPVLRSIRAELAALTGQLASASAAAASVAYSDRELVRTVIVPELSRLGWRS